jgi:hypothetical protein
MIPAIVDDRLTPTFYEEALVSQGLEQKVQIELLHSFL